MNVRSLERLKEIKEFKGEYAVFEFQEENNTYKGLINRKGEVVWNDKIVFPIMKVYGYESVFMSIKPGTKEFYYFDAALQKYIEKPTLVKCEKEKTKSELIAEQSEWIKYTDKDGILITFQTHQRLTDDLLSYIKWPDNVWGIKDLEGNILVPAQYDTIFRGADNGHFVVKKDGKCGVIDIHNNRTIPFEYAHLYGLQGKYYVVRDMMCKHGVIDTENKVIIPFEYDYLHPAKDEGIELMSVKKDGELFFVNSKNERVELF